MNFTFNSSGNTFRGITFYFLNASQRPLHSADLIAPERRSKSERTCDRRKNRNGFLLTHGSAILFRCAFLVKPHPVLRRRYSRWMFLAARPPPTPFVPFAFLIAVISNPARTRRRGSLLPPLPPPSCVFGHGYAVACVGEPPSGRPARYDGPPIPITTWPYVYFAALRVTDLTVMPLCTAPGFPLPDYTSCAIGIIRRGPLRRF